VARLLALAYFLFVWHNQHILGFLTNSQAFCFFAQMRSWQAARATL
jgi:hypothetical protein